MNNQMQEAFEKWAKANHDKFYGDNRDVLKYGTYFPSSKEMMWIAWQAAIASIPRNFCPACGKRLSADGELT